MKKLYGEFEREDWLRVSGLKEEEIPHTIILHGEDDNVAENIAHWESSFENVICRPRWNMSVGKRNGRRIGFANVIWAPMAALLVHKYAMLGTRRFIQTGYCGGLTENLKYGDVLVVSQAKGEDGVSTAYLPGKMLFKPNAALTKRAEELLESSSQSYKVGQVISTSAMFLETHDIIKQWADQGFVGVDGETATTFAVAERFGAEAVAILTCSDNLARGDNIWETSMEAEDAEDRAFEKIQEVALALA